MLQWMNAIYWFIKWQAKRGSPVYGWASFDSGGGGGGEDENYNSQDNTLDTWGGESFFDIGSHFHEQSGKRNAG